MTKNESFKRRIRARMAKTGEKYVAARRVLIEQSADRGERRWASEPDHSDEVIRERTGRGWDEWRELIDSWPGHTEGHAAIAAWLQKQHQIDGWWAQSITVAYEQARGMRAPGQRADGTYSVTASKTIGVPVETLFAAFHDEQMRDDWLGEFEFRVRTARPGKSITADWEDGSTRLSIGFTAKGGSKSQVALVHEKIVDPQHADDLKAFWRERMNLLKALLEG